jgi:hypothetical protein
MSEFEFVLILVSVVAGFAISEILSGWGLVIRERVSIYEIGVHIIASLWLLLMIIRCVWVLWLFREADWSFIEFCLALAPVLVLALAAYVTNPARDQSFTPATHYLKHARPFCYLGAVFLILWNFGTLRTLILANGFTSPGSVSAIIIAIGLVGLAHVRKPVIHGVAFTALVAGVFYISSIAVTSLTTT